MSTEIITPGFEIPGLNWNVNTGAEEDEASVGRAAVLSKREDLDSIFSEIENVVRKLRVHCTHSGVTALRKLACRLSVRASLSGQPSSLSYSGTHALFVKTITDMDYGYEAFRDSWRLPDMSWLADLFSTWEQDAMHEEDPRRCVIADVAADKVSL